MHTILNFATKFFEMFTKKQSEHPHKVFQVFHVRFWTTKPPDFGPNPNKDEKSAPSHLRHLMSAQNTQKGNPPTCRQPDTVLQAIAEVFFGEADFLFSSIPLDITK